MVEPFKSMQSTMPAFKTGLKVEERWDVLAYVHAYFHLGLAKWKIPAAATGSDGGEKGHHHGHHNH